MSIAKDMEEAEKSLKEKEITCSILQEHYTQPKDLPCLHCYCKHCILKLALRRGKNQPFSCPDCCKEATLPEDKEDNLQTAFFIYRFKELCDKQKRTLSNEEVKCEVCTTSQLKAEAFCRQCDKFMCEKCVEAHERMKVVFDGHEVLFLDKVKKVRAKDVPPKDCTAKKCEVNTKSLKIFCFDCNGLFCCDCALKDHRDHHFDFTNLAAENKRKELMESLKPLRKVAANLSCAVEKIQTTEYELAVQGEAVANTIRTSFEELHTIIERHMQKMLEEAKKRVCEKLENLEGQKKDIFISLKEVQRIVDYTEQCVKHCSNDKVMCAHAEIASVIQQKIIEDSTKPGQKLTLMEKVDVAVEVSCAEALEQLLQTQAKITRLPVSFDINTVSSKADDRKLSEAVLCTTPLYGNNPAVQIDCHMKCLHSGALIKSSTEEVGANQHRIQFKPTHRGRHELTISVDGHQVEGSPFPVFVLLLSQLGRCVKVWDGVTMPVGITVNSKDEIIVAERYGDVVVLDKEGKRLRSINHSEHKFEDLEGIAVDSEDNIYFTDLRTNRIFKSNKNCSEVLVHIVKQVYTDVAVVGDEVMVTEVGNGGRIMVYDKDLKYVRQIVGEDKNTLCYLSPDSHQNVYVSVLAKSSIQVFSNDGEFLCSFGCDEDGVKRLKSPRGVCVAGQYVYVADFGVRKIVVFTTEGDYVTSFGDGYYTHVCVDQGGFVYATDFGSNKIDIF